MSRNVPQNAVVLEFTSCKLVRRRVSILFSPSFQPPKSPRTPLLPSRTHSDVLSPLGLQQSQRGISPLEKQQQTTSRLHLVSQRPPTLALPFSTSLLHFHTMRLLSFGLLVLTLFASSSLAQGTAAATGTGTAESSTPTSSSSGPTLITPQNGFGGNVSIYTCYPWEKKTRREGRE